MCSFPQDFDKEKANQSLKYKKREVENENKKEGLALYKNTQYLIYQITKVCAFF